MLWLFLDLNYSFSCLHCHIIISSIYLRQTVESMQAEVDQQKVEDEAWIQKQELLQKAEETRREMLLEEEARVIQQRQRCVLV